MYHAPDKGRATRTAFLWAAAALLMAVFFGATAKSSHRKHASEKITLARLQPILHNLPLLTFLVIVFFAALFSTVFWNFYGVYFTDIGGSSSLFGVAIAISAVAEIPFYFLATPILRRFGIQKVLLFTFACTTLRLFAYAFISNPRIAIWIEMSNGISWTLFWVAAVEEVNRLVVPQWRATGQALLNAACWGAAIILGMLANGFLLDYFKIHFVSSWLHFAIQKVCFVSGLLFAALTLVAAAYFIVVGSKASAVPEAPCSVSERLA